MTNVVSVRGISRVYKGDGTSFQAVREVAVEVARGEFVAIMGQSGSGKSTLLNLIHNLDVASNIELPGLLAGLPTAEVRRQARELMESVGITELAGKMPGQLSGGQRQRVAICRALINRPTLLLADEPTGALDQESGQAVLRLFRRLHTEGQTIVMVTHDPKVAAYAERILTMQDGKIVAETRPSDAGGERLMERILGARQIVG